METKFALGVLLVIAGVVVLAYSGIDFMTPRDSIDFLGVELRTVEHRYVPPAIGVMALMGGLLMLTPKPTWAGRTRYRH